MSKSVVTFGVCILTRLKNKCTDEIRLLDTRTPALSSYARDQTVLDVVLLLPAGLGPVLVPPTTPPAMGLIK